MSSPGAVSLGRRAPSAPEDSVRVAFVGSTRLLDACAPAAGIYGLRTERIPVGDAPGGESARAALERFRPDVAVIFDPLSFAARIATEAIGTTLGVLVNGVGDSEGVSVLPQLERLVSFDPALTGELVAGRPVWRSMPPPVSDAYFGVLRPQHGAPRAMTLGASTEHREAMLMPAKHHHDVLQLIHGVSGEALVELLREYNVGVFVPEQEGGGFSHEAAVHLAAGQLLLASAARPAYGLERNIDYLHFGSADELVWMLDRLGRFPEMHHRVRVRGHLKAQQFRASRVFARLIEDLLLDVDAFGEERPMPAG